MGGVELQPDGVYRVADRLREGAERAASAGTSMASLGAVLPAPPAGHRLLSAVDALSAEWTAVADDLTAGLSQLANWVDDAAVALISVDDDAAGVFRGIPR